MLRNYFADLELEVDASPTEIRRAFKRLARRFHPDVNPGDSLAVESFRRIKEAFDFLSDEAKASNLRSELKERFQRAEQEFGRWDTFFGTRPRDREEFNQSWIEEPSYKEAPDPNARGEELDLHLRVNHVGDLDQLDYEYLLPCQDCRGQGGSSGAVTVTCKKCAGLGFQSIERGAFRWKKSCEGCKGRGYQVADPCGTCRGVGKVREHQRLRVAAPSGFTSEQGLRVKGYGHISYDGKQRGDLWLYLKK